MVSAADSRSCDRRFDSDTGNCECLWREKLLNSKMPRQDMVAYAAGLFHRNFLSSFSIMLHLVAQQLRPGREHIRWGNRENKPYKLKLFFPIWHLNKKKMLCSTHKLNSILLKHILQNIDFYIIHKGLIIKGAMKDRKTV